MCASANALVLACKPLNNTCAFLCASSFRTAASSGCSPNSIFNSSILTRALPHIKNGCKGTTFFSKLQMNSTKNFFLSKKNAHICIYQKKAVILRSQLYETRKNRKKHIKNN